MADKVKVILPDGSKKEYSSGITISEIIREFPDGVHIGRQSGRERKRWGKGLTTHALGPKILMKSGFS